MKLGIVGLPNVGKSTLFNAITKAGAEAANYPFCTIEPNVGIVTVPDARITKLHEIYNSKKTIYATSRVWSKARRRARDSATNSSDTSERLRPSCTLSAVLKTTILYT